MTQFGPPPGRRPIAALIKIGCLVALLVAANYGFDLLAQRLDFDIRPSNEDVIHRLIMSVAVLYAVALAVPFVPGVEIGVGLMAVLGLKIVPLVYLSTVAGLCLAFLVGRFVPVSVLARLSRDLHLIRVEQLLLRFDDVPESEKLSFLVAAAPNGLSGFLLRHRYIALAALINLPGNFLIGGGGGIALLAGASRVFGWPFFILTVAIAVSPVPLALLVFGPDILSH